MQIVGIDIADREETHVHTIDMWFSKQRNVWCVERLNHDGDLIGAVHHCASKDDAQSCLDHWLRSHVETHLVAPRESALSVKAAKKPPARERRRAA